VLLRRVSERADRIEEAVVRRLARYGVRTLRVCLGIIFFWFGVLKFEPGLSPADALAVRTIDTLTMHLITGDTARILLALLESGIGIGLIFGILRRPTLIALGLHLAGTFTPLLFFPDETWKAPFVATLEGQYILKNIVLISAGLVIAATVRGGDLVASRSAVRTDRNRT
jgi:uncharacterized membrane protein YphA (DoxX/SURF4 family)